MGATLLDKGVEISSIVQELKLGNEEDFVTASQSGIVIEEREKYQLANSEEKAIELIDAGNIQGLRDLVITMNKGMRMAQSQIDVNLKENSFNLEANSSSNRVRKEIEQIETLEFIMHILNEI
jgi:hypothetical protein